MHGSDGIRFYPRIKAVTSRWPTDAGAPSGFHMPTSS
jgi:malonate-semialdehyde dehydrogenase (acetylating)/methylmalonate-semialdehyde dehydrogenase